MKKQYWAWLVVSLLATTPAAAQAFMADFKTAYRQGDTAATWQVLRRWQQARPQDPEGHIARFNYLLKQAEVVELRAGSGGQPGTLVLTDKKGRPAGTLGTGYRPDMAARACAALRQGLAVAPDRLDMWFGLAKTYEETGQPAEQVKALTEALATHAKGRPWYWSQGQPLPEPEAEFVPGALEQYAGVYFRQEAPELETAGQLAALIVQYYPQSALGPFNMGVYYARKDQHQQAYTALQQADRLQPNDMSTLANLTKLAVELRRKPDAEQYLAQLRKLPDAKQAVADLAPLVRKLK
jgi:tetratricopeptide (TPR) repeat protein